MTYADKIKAMIMDADKQYCDAGYLSNRVTEQEKDTFSNVRVHCEAIIKLLNALHTSLPTDRAQMHI